ncbi:uncharacterized protein LOC126592718 [Malus sylvestris]|uniref:uncharacterized protein LOC126592718 n=1 Tax=Malus sylvestris TaxID=3752 RepID=UPI0021ABA2BD|nr:uncharacterized protein LOC126592718 [Malus sylvestris]
MASAIHFPLALKSGGFPLEASDYSTIFGLPWTSLHFKLLFGLGIHGFQSRNGTQEFSSSCCPILLLVCFLCGSKTQNKEGEEIEQESQETTSLRLVVGQNHFAAPS